jgi:hypothetical protein
LILELEHEYRVPLKFVVYRYLKKVGKITQNFVNLSTSSVCTVLYTTGI